MKYNRRSVSQKIKKKKAGSTKATQLSEKLITLNQYNKVAGVPAAKNIFERKTIKIHTTSVFKG